MKHNSLLNFGVVGSVILAICCFTPLLVVLLGLVGLSAIVGMLDLVLLPTLGLFIAITILALIKRARP